MVAPDQAHWCGLLNPENAVFLVAGRCGRALSEAMTEKKIILLIMLYGMTAGSFRRVVAGREDICSDRTIRRIKEQARFIAKQVIVGRSSITD